MKLDRDKQRELLELLAEHYPNKFYVSDIIPDDENEERALYANLIYLHEHGLIEAEAITALQELTVTTARLTMRGVDFLKDDGGLSAILDVQTIRLHADTLRELLQQKIDQSDLSPEEKSTFKKHVETASHEVVRTIAQKTVEWSVLNGEAWRRLIDIVLL